MKGELVGFDDCGELVGFIVGIIGEFDGWDVIGDLVGVDDSGECVGMDVGIMGDPLG